MEKVLSFSNEQKNLIWQTKVQPNSGTEAEAKHFIEVCETFGLNPLLDDIVFQKYETRQGPRTNFITKRDGLLRVASLQPDYVGAPVANVVREGDDFEFIPSEGDVKHKFGKKRGRIIGAYAVMYHKRFRPVSVFVDFEEYFRANARSQQSKGGSPIWDAMPSAMIVKVAEVFVLRRQFPLGGLMTAEEMGLDDIGSHDHTESQAGETQPALPSNSPASVSANTVNQNEKKGNQKTESQKDEKALEQKHPVKQEEQRNKQPEKEPTESQGNRAKEPEQQGQQEEKPSDKTASDSIVGQYILEKCQAGTSPSGIPFAKLTVKDQEGEQKLVLAKGQEAVNLTDQIPEETPFDMDIHEENGFYFLEGINGKRLSQMAS